MCRFEAGLDKLHMSQKSEVVVITGASAGVGRATAREFGRRAAKVALLARGREGLEAAKREIESMGGEALVLPTDVAASEEVDAAAAAVVERWGAIDVWVNNAMASVFSPTWEMTAEDYARVTAVTYLGVVHGTLAALRHMMPNNRGTIVQVGSALAYRSIPLQSAYCAAKHAVVGFCDSLRPELLHRKSDVWVTVVHLPAMNTPQFDWVKSRLPRRAQPVPPIYQPEVAARAIYWAAHHRRREVEVGWPTVEAIMGQKVAPWLLAKYLGRTGFASQQTNEPKPPDQPDNLWKPVAGDHGAHGRFDARSRHTSLQAWANMHRGALSVALGAALVVGATAAIASR